MLHCISREQCTKMLLSNIIIKLVAYRAGGDIEKCVVLYVLLGSVNC